MTQLIELVGRQFPGVLVHVITLGRTPTRRATDVLSYFDRPGTSNFFH